MSWSILELPKFLGGLNIGNLQKKNMCLLFRWIWRFFSDPSALWQKVIQAKYHYGPSHSTLDLNIPHQGGLWKVISAVILQNPIVRSLTKTKTRSKVMNGLNTLFWHHIWVGEQPLRIPRLFCLSSSPDGSVSSFGL